MTTYRFAFPGGPARSMMQLLNGFSLLFAVLFAALGAIGLIVTKRGQHDPQLMYAAARALAVASASVLVISLTHFFIIPTMLFAAVTVCFAIAAVRAPGQ